MTSAISEYQFYEFRAVDRPLDDAAQEEIQRLSSRVEPTPRSAVFTYSFGDFRGDAIKVLMKHYDLMLYMANWGTRRIALRLPKSLIDQRVLRPYLVERLIMAKTMGTHLLLDINIYEDGGEACRDWFEGDGQAGRIEPVRDELLRGDHRVLYLAWLAAVQIDPELEDATEPVEDLQSAHRKKTVLAEPARRTVTELRHLAAVQRKKREKREADAARRARIRQLEKLEEHYEQTWDRIDELLKESRAKAHKEAVTLLVDLRDLAEYRGLSGPFQLRFGRILAAAKSRPAVMRRLREAGLAE